MPLNHTINNRKPEPGAIRLATRRIHAREGSEQVRDLWVWNASAMVGDFDQDV
jgi:hypothetical protein